MVGAREADERRRTFFNTSSGEVEAQRHRWAFFSGLSLFRAEDAIPEALRRRAPLQEHDRKRRRLVGQYLESFYRPLLLQIVDFPVGQIAHDLRRDRVPD